MFLLRNRIEYSFVFSFFEGHTLLRITHTTLAEIEKRLVRFNFKTEIVRDLRACMEAKAQQFSLCTFHKYSTIQTKPK